MKYNFTQAVCNSKADEATRNALMALKEDNDGLNRKLSELQDQLIELTVTVSEKNVVNFIFMLDGNNEIGAMMEECGLTKCKIITDDRANYNLEKDDREIKRLINECLERTARMQAKQSNLIDEESEKKLRNYLEKNPNIMEAFLGLFHVIGVTDLPLVVLKGLPLDDILDMLKAYITDKATK